MRTLIYCTAYAPSRMLWDRRYRRWIDAIQAGTLAHDQIVLADDGSPVLPGWPDTDIVTVRSLDDIAGIRSTAPVLLLRFPDRLGRADVYDFPGWFRSFAAGARYAETSGFEKVLHIESDAYLISGRMHDWANQANTGWITPFSAKYNFPEMAIQVIAPDQLANFAGFARRPYAEMIGVTHETMLPFTHVEKDFIGDRFGEDEAGIPAGADFATQVPAQREPSYYWWLAGEAAPVQHGPDRIVYLFSRGERGIELFGDGWSNPEPRGTWMLNMLSIIKLPALPKAQPFDMVLQMIPNIQRERLRFQRLFVQLNSVPIGEFDCNGTSFTGCHIPPGLLRGDGNDRLRFLHPDAAQPARFQGNDKRNLAIMLRSLTLLPRLDVAD